MLRFSFAVRLWFVSQMCVVTAARETCWYSKRCLSSYLLIFSVFSSCMFLLFASYLRFARSTVPHAIECSKIQGDDEANQRGPRRKWSIIFMKFCSPSQTGTKFADTTCTSLLQLYHNVSYSATSYHRAADTPAALFPVLTAVCSCCFRCRTK